MLLPDSTSADVPAPSGNRKHDESDYRGQRRFSENLELKFEMGGTDGLYLLCIRVVRLRFAGDKGNSSDMRVAI